MAIVVVLLHWRLLQRIRYLASVLRTSACLGLGQKLSFCSAQSEVDFGHASAVSFGWVWSFDSVFRISSFVPSALAEHAASWVSAVARWAMVDKHTPAREARRASMSPGWCRLYLGFLLLYPVFMPLFGGRGAGRLRCRCLWRHRRAGGRRFCGSGTRGGRRRGLPGSAR